jgi:hypothetical protein
LSCMNAIIRRPVSPGLSGWKYTTAGRPVRL